jgi:hypothetical protein
MNFTEGLLQTNTVVAEHNGFTPTPLHTTSQPHSFLKIYHHITP